MKQLLGKLQHRWGDMQVINLFVRTFFNKPILNLDLINRNLKYKLKADRSIFF